MKITDILGFGSEEVYQQPFSEAEVLRRRVDYIIRIDMGTVWGASRDLIEDGPIFEPKVPAEQAQHLASAAVSETALQDHEEAQRQYFWGQQAKSLANHASDIVAEQAPELKSEADSHEYELPA